MPRPVPASQSMPTRSPLRRHATARPCAVAPPGGSRAGVMLRRTGRPVLRDRRAARPLPAAHRDAAGRSVARHPHPYLVDRREHGDVGRRGRYLHERRRLGRPRPRGRGCSSSYAAPRSTSSSSGSAGAPRVSSPRSPCAVCSSPSARSPTACSSRSGAAVVAHSWSWSPSPPSSLRPPPRLARVERAGRRRPRARHPLHPRVLLRRVPGRRARVDERCRSGVPARAPAHGTRDWRGIGLATMPWTDFGSARRMGGRSLRLVTVLVSRRRRAPARLTEAGRPCRSSPPGSVPPRGRLVGSVRRVSPSTTASGPPIVPATAEKVRPCTSVGVIRTQRSFASGAHGLTPRPSTRSISLSRSSC